MDMTSFLQGIAPRATNQLLQSSSPRGSPRAHGWTERPRRSTPSAIECQDVRDWRPDLDEEMAHHEAVMAGATEMDGRDGEKFLVFLRFVFTPFSRPPYAQDAFDPSMPDVCCPPAWATEIGFSGNCVSGGGLQGGRAGLTLNA